MNIDTTLIEYRHRLTQPSQTKVLSTSQRWRPSRWSPSMPRRAMRGWMPRAWYDRRQRERSGRPHETAEHYRASSRAIKSKLSCMLTLDS